MTGDSPADAYNLESGDFADFHELSLRVLSMQLANHLIIYRTGAGQSTENG